MASDLVIEFEFRTKRFNDAARGLLAFSDSVSASFDRVPAILRAQLQEFLNTVAEALSRRHGNPWPAGTSATSLSRRSGKLIASIKDSVQVYGDSIENIYGTIGAGFYGKTHEFGATITPKRAQYLTVPLPAALNADGTPKKKSAREWDKTFVIRSKAGNLLIVRRDGAEIVPLYVLKKSVYVPPRLLMGTTIKTGIPYFVDHAMEAMMKELQAGMAK